MGPNRGLRHGYGSLSGTLASSLTTKKRLAYNVSPDHRIATAYITRAVQPLTSCVSFSPPSTLRLQIFEPKEKEKKKSQAHHTAQPEVTVAPSSTTNRFRSFWKEAATEENTRVSLCPP